jgi:hypothetical protein
LYAFGYGEREVSEDNYDSQTSKPTEEMLERNGPIYNYFEKMKSKISETIKAFLDSQIADT